MENPEESEAAATEAARKSPARLSERRMASLREIGTPRRGGSSGSKCGYEARGRVEEDRPASPAAAKSLMERGTPQVGPARFDGVSPQFFGALFELGFVAFAASLRKTKD